MQQFFSTRRALPLLPLASHRSSSSTHTRGLTISGIPPLSTPLTNSTSVRRAISCGRVGLRLLSRPDRPTPCALSGGVDCVCNRHHAPVLIAQNSAAASAGRRGRRRAQRLSDRARRRARMKRSASARGRRTIARRLAKTTASSPPLPLPLHEKQGWWGRGNVRRSCACDRDRVYGATVCLSSHSPPFVSGDHLHASTSVSFANEEHLAWRAVGRGIYQGMVLGVGGWEGLAGWERHAGGKATLGMGRRRRRDNIFIIETRVYTAICTVK